MAQNTNVELPELAYNRADYTALRAYCLKIPLQPIADLYYSEDSPQVEQGLERWLIDMRTRLIERAIEHNPLMAETLQGARQGGAITTRALNILIQAAEMPKPAPSRPQKISQWFRPKTASAFKAEGVLTLGDVVDLINRRGPGWWRSVPRIGAGRADATLRFLLPVLDPTRKPDLAPLGTFPLPGWLSGTDGVNRSPAICFISAHNDLEAINTYLNRFMGQDHTERAYRKELERFILWCALVACKPMSSLLVNDCEAYKNFLRAPLPEFCGPHTVKTSNRWKPSADGPMSATSQKQAMLVRCEERSTGWSRCATWPEIRELR
ncbi:phage integrase family protein [Massilia sp. CFBP9012]|uniref:phage integrase family protein n=1 Tax=Massilia sp. CFBP9012 TaxID=3096531 RepID=UPI002A6B16B0|nr:phage integrase family protein [Massilia sp. CFBP9012]MDY0977722.1 phage integrase family protein [Massilia sp. CFBP9012]